MDIIYPSDKQLAARYGNSRASIWRWIETRGFPKPIKFSPGCTRWRLEDIEAWEARIRATGTPQSRESEALKK